MKRFTGLIISFIFILNLCACGEAEAPIIVPASYGDAIEVTPTPKPTRMPVPIYVPEVEETEEPVEEEPAQVDITILMETDETLSNIFSVIAVSGDAGFYDVDGNSLNDVAINTAGADALICWLLSDEGRELTESYGEKVSEEELFTVNDSAPKYVGEIPEANEETKLVRLSTTDAVKESGLLNYLLPVFSKEYGYEVEVRYSQKAKAFSAAKHGKADLLLTNDEVNEELFIADGFARIPQPLDSERVLLMDNYFVICGPSDDPAGVRDAKDPFEAFSRIASGKYSFVSRADGSVVHLKELSLWDEELGITRSEGSYFDYLDWYIPSNAGMMDTLRVAENADAYVLADRASLLRFTAENGDIPILK